MKKFLFLIGLMTCMCLMVTSCKSEDEEDINKNSNDFSMANVLGRGEHQGYWVVNDVPADSCVMNYNGTVLSFSNLPIKTILEFTERYRNKGSAMAQYSSFLHPDSKSISELQVEADQLVLFPVIVGYSGKNLYFNSSVQHVSMIPPSGYEEDYSAMYYSFVIDNGEEKIPISMVFDRDTYGIFDAGKKSQVIKLYIKEITFLLPKRNEITVYFDPMMELTFISNN